ncbi:HDIG domain-containing metalloprotein [Desulfofalx alkaliphila]|uniref:HDIG domain-containing metalloprotein n=1 Tax=Desulfofalx alkaliphila TaxID=105483 RepID=UPI0004E1122D|nr:HDIG domain-containing metalloprotein [Desulfofalx alkaliphila]
MNRNQAMDLLKKHLKNKNLMKHCLAVEAVMAGLARHFGEDEEKWALAGLLHDIDYDFTKDDPQRHSLEGAKILEEAGLPEEVVYAVKVHNEAHGLPRNSLMDKALYSVDPLTGLITAAALIRPEKSLFAVNVESLMKRYGEKAFARGANRNAIAACTELGISMEEFMAIGLEAMQGIANELGLA